MGVLKSISTEHDLQKHITKSSLKAKLGDASFKLKSTLPGNKFAIEGDYKGFEVKYDFATKDIEIEKKWKVKPGELKIQQKVPASKFYLVPSPEISLKAKPLDKKKVTAEVEPSYSLLDRKAKLESSLEIHKQHKIKLEADNKSGVRNATVSLSTKPKGGLAKAAKQVTLKYSMNAGPSVVHEVEPFNGKVALKSTVGINAKDVKLVADIKPGKIAGVKPKLTVESKVSAKAPTKPTFVLGASLDF